MKAPRLLSPVLVTGLLLSLSAALPLRVAASEFTEKLKALREKGDTAAVEAFLAEAEKSQADNPDYYAMASNYWWSQAQEINISTKPAGGQDLQVQSLDGQPVGSISTSGDLNPALKEKALALTKEGFQRFPKRLDIGFGLAWVQHSMGKDPEAVETVCQILKTSHDEPAASLLTGDNQPLPDPPGIFVPESVQGYSVPLMQKGTPEADALCKRLCQATIAAFPEHPYAYNILAALADAAGDQPEKMKMLKLANEKAPEDSLILFNLGNAYEKAGNKDEALAAYRKIIKLKDLSPEDKAEAEESIKRLAPPPAEKKKKAKAGK